MDLPFFLIVILIVTILVIVAIAYKNRSSREENVIGEEFTKPKNYDKSESQLAIERLKQNIGKIDPSYSRVRIVEGFKGANTKNKKVISICLRNPETGDFYSENTLMYVLLHELAHVISPTYGHDENFKERMNRLLSQAEKLGLYHPDIPIPRIYCGVKSNGH